MASTLGGALGILRGIRFSLRGGGPSTVKDGASTQGHQHRPRDSEPGSNGRVAQKKEGGAILWGQPWPFPLPPLWARPWCSSLPSVQVSECWRCFLGGTSVTVFMTYPRSLPLGGMGCVFLHLVWPLTFLTLSGGVLEFGVRATPFPKVLLLLLRH